MRKHSTSDAPMTQATTRGMSKRIRPMIPLTSMSGRKAATVVRDEARDRDEHAFGTAPGRRERPGAVLMLGERVFTDHDRIVDDDSRWP